MPTYEDITQQHQLLSTYRYTLAHHLQQQAKHGNAYTPPSISHGIRECRDNIQRIKSILRNWGIEIEDHPDDEITEISFTKNTTIKFLNQNHITQLCVESIFYQLIRHTRDEAEGRIYAAIESRRRYIIATLVFQIGHVISNSNLYNTYEYNQLERNLENIKLSKIFRETKNILSLQGIYRSYQSDLSNYILKSSHSELEMEIRNIDSTTPQFLDASITWAKELAREFVYSWSIYLNKLGPDYTKIKILDSGIDISSFLDRNGLLNLEIPETKEHPFYNLRISSTFIDFLEVLSKLHKELISLSIALEKLEEQITQ